MYYAKSTGGFYSPDINPVIPADAVEISDETHRALLEGQAAGKLIVADADGRPTLQDPPPPPPAPIPNVSPRQIRQALTRLNLRQGVEAAVAAGDQDLKDWWEFSTEFDRRHPLVAQMGASLGVTADQLDGLWALAGSL